MFSKLKKIFKGSEKEDKKPPSTNQKTDHSSANQVEEKPFNSEDIAHARELNLSFTSSLLGVRAVETEEAKSQEADLRIALDAEVLGMTEESIPKLSRSALDLMNKLIDPETDQKSIVAAVNENPGLAGKVISIANSPVYVGSGAEIKSIEHALAMLGHVQLKKVVMSSLVADKFEINALYFKTFDKALWEHSSEVAQNSSVIASAAGADEGACYFLGLIHDIGKLIIFKKLVELHSQEQQQPHPVVFSRLLNDYSNTLTVRACEVWGLPQNWYQPLVESQEASLEELASPEAIALFLGNYLAELKALYDIAEITEFELIWRLGELGEYAEYFKRLYPDTLPEQ